MAPEKNKIKIGLFYNLAKDFPVKDNYSGDLHLEWDNQETIDDIKESLENLDYQVIDFGDPKNLLKDSILCEIDIVFSICEMHGYRFRESLVSSLCELLKLPYTFSTPDTLMIGLDKNLCNLLLKQNKIPIPEFYCVEDINELSKHSLKIYPYFVKPSCEGSGIGISTDSIVYSKDDLEKQVEFLVNKYKQPALIQTYLPNEDITIGVLEIENEVISLTPLIGKLGVSMNPLPSDNILFNRVKKIAEQVFRIMKCRDIARIDLKLSESNDVYFLEINPLPLLTKNKGYFMKSAKFYGFSYEQVLDFVIQNTKKRFSIEQTL